MLTSGGDGRRFTVGFSNYLTRSKIQLVTLVGDEAKTVSAVQVLSLSLPPPTFLRIVLSAIFSYEGHSNLRIEDTTFAI